MTRFPPMPTENRVLDLLAEQATVGLEAAAAGELHAMLTGLGVREDEVSLEASAAALALAFVSQEGVMHPPPALMERLHAAGRAWCEAEAAQRRGREMGAARPPAQDRSRPVMRAAALKPSGLRWVPWLAAAAGVSLAAIAWMPNRSVPRTPGPIAAVSGDPSAVRLAWSDWDNPEQKGVTGEVVWSESKQAGYMKFVGLKPNDPGKEQYQLWIIDSRGMQQRISGAIFNAQPGETIVPITPGIPVKEAAAFALTIEKPGGVWVSDMTRRVVIAAKKT